MARAPLRNLITGGAGFVVSHLFDRLMKSGEEIIEYCMIIHLLSLYIMKSLRLSN